MVEGYDASKVKAERPGKLNMANKMRTKRQKPLSGKGKSKEESLQHPLPSYVSHPAVTPGLHQGPRRRHHRQDIDGSAPQWHFRLSFRPSFGSPALTSLPSHPFLCAYQETPDQSRRTVPDGFFRPSIPLGLSGHLQAIGGAHA